MGVVELAADPRAAKLAVALVRALPLRTALRLADLLADRAASQADSAMVRGLRHNQSVVRGLPIDHPEIDRAAQTVMRTTARGYVHLFKNLRQPVEQIRSRWVIEQHIIDTILPYHERGQGVFWAGFHMAGFDQIYISLGTYQFPVLGLTYPDPKGIYAFQNEVRLASGANLAPISPQVLRQGLRYLKQGGVVLTAVDRPDPNGEILQFFGRPARLPTGHARLALHAKAPLAVGVTQRTGEGTNRAILLDFIEPQPSRDVAADALALSQRVLNIFEGYLRQHPDEWLMFFPVWGGL